MKGDIDFDSFWQEHKKNALTYTIRIIWQWPLALICGGILTLIIYEAFPSPGRYQLEDLFHKQTWLDFYPRLLYAIFLGYIVGLPISHLAILFLEWLKYRKDEPSAFTHGGWKIEGPPGYARRLKEVGAETFAVAGEPLQVHVLAENHRRIEGDFSEAILLDHLRRKFARTDNKPLVDSKDHLVWKITQSSGTEVHIDLQRQPQADPPVWTMRTEFYEWAGRKNPPRLAHTYITEFVCSSTSSTQP